MPVCTLIAKFRKRKSSVPYIARYRYVRAKGLEARPNIDAVGKVDSSLALSLAGTTNYESCRGISRISSA